MSTKKRRGGYIATPEGVKKLKDAKTTKKYTYEMIVKEAEVTDNVITLDQVKRLFNPQWGNGQYKIGEEAVQAICTVLDLRPEDIVADWYAVEIPSSDSAGGVLVTQDENNIETPNTEVLRRIEQAAKDGVEELDLSSMKLTELPAEIGQLTNLTELNLESNDLRSFPSEIVKLINLKVLNLNNNDLRSLPPQIGQLTNLTKLDLDNNDLENLPPQIGQLTNLTELYLKNNDLESLPPQIGQLTNLQQLDFNTNKLRSLPPQIGQLTNLPRLNLNNNDLRSLPLEIFKLTNLERLYLDNNKLRSLPPQIGQLTNLTELYLNNNDLKNLPPQIGQLTNLTRLAINHNDLESLPPEIGQLANLTKLYLDSNSLKNLPPEIGQLMKLERLYLDSNSLKNLPPEIGQLNKLTELYLHSNPLGILPEIVDRYDRPASIIDYYFSLQNNQKKPGNKAKKFSSEEGSVDPTCLNEAKMLLVGQSGVGKTCLRERLIEDKYLEGRNTTDGIDLKTWDIEVDKRQIQVNVWDFGGQEIMHSTHQFFLTKRSLYLLVLDNTLREEENRLEYWLKIIQSFGKDSPVIIVGNKTDQHPFDIDKRGLRQKYPQIKDFIETSCKTGAGIDDLKASIEEEISQLKHIDDQLPLSWFKIKKQLEDLEKDYIPYHEYKSICKEKGVTEENNQSNLIQLLHDLGVVLNFKDDDRLQDTHVLNPEWVTNGVYKILNDNKLIKDDKGILSRESLSRILDDKRYPQNKQIFIIDMMRKFTLCFDIVRDKQFLIPDILPKEEPEFSTEEWKNTLAFEYHYPVLPSSIISRLMVLMNLFIHDKTYWRSGVVLEDGKNTALVKADREDKKIIIRVKGQENTRRDLLSSIRSEFEKIHKTIPGIVPEQKVPLIDHPEIVLDYEDLVGLEEMGETYKVVGKIRERISLKKLLNGIEEEGKRKKQDD